MALISPRYTITNKVDANAGDLIQLRVRGAFHRYLVVIRHGRDGPAKMLVDLSDFRCFFADPWPDPVVRVEDRWRFKLSGDPATAHESAFNAQPGKVCVAGHGHFLSVRLSDDDPGVINLETYGVFEAQTGRCVSFDWNIEVEDAEKSVWGIYEIPRPPANG